MATAIASIRERTRTSAGNDSRPAPESRLQRDHCVADHLHAAGHKLRHHASNQVGYLRPPRARGAYTRALNLCWIDASRDTSLAHRGVQSLPRARLSQSDDVAPTRCRHAQHRFSVADRASRLRRSAVNAQVDRHALVLTYPRREVAGLFTSRVRASWS